METLYIQLTRNPQLFGLFYSLAFLVVLIILIGEGYKRKIPLLQWILILTFSRILFIIGTKLFALPLYDLQFMVENLTLAPENGKVVYGGLLLGTIGLLAGKHWMRINRPLADAFAVVLPLGMAIQRFGCFFAGCCHGSPTDVFWAVKYPVNTLAHYHHYQQTLIGDDDLFSLSVHPSQLYEVAGALLVVAIVWFFRNRWKSAGSSFLLSLILFALARFLVEFFRDPLAHTNGGMVVGPLNLIQWGIVLLLTILIPVLIVRERHPKPATRVLPVPDSSPGAVILFFSASALLIMIFSNWFSTFELLALLMVFSLAFILTTIHIFHNRQQPVYRLAYIFLLAIPMAAVGLSFTNLQGDSTEVRKTVSVGVGYSSGNFDNSVRTFEGTGECGPIYRSTYFRQRYSLFGAQINLKNEYLSQKTSVTYGLNIYGGTHSERLLTENVGNSNVWDEYKVFGVNPNIQLDSKWVGAGGGLHVGNLSYVLDENSKVDSDKSGRILTNLYPMFSFRFGPKKVLFGEYRFADWFPSALPGYRHQFSLGSGLGTDNGFNIRVGSSNYGMLIASEIPFKNGLTLSPLLHFSQVNSSSNQTQFSVGVKYAISQKEKKRPILR
jgi:phosphatidylglycerol:prolipoprotein diacylglycerol transferase